METEIRVSPFSCGSQFMDWESSNCDNCTKHGYFADPATQNDWVWACDIQKAIGASQFEDGRISSEIASRMHCDPGAYGWRCGELDPIYPIERWFAHYGSSPKVLRPLWWRLREAWRAAQKFWDSPWNPEVDIYGEMGRVSLRTAWAIGWAWNHDAKMVKPGWTRPPLGDPIAKAGEAR